MNTRCLATWAYFILFASAQLAVAQALPPELKPLAEKYGTDTAAIARAQDEAIATVKKTYLAALETAVQKATQAGKAESIKALMEEQQLVNKGEVPTGAGPADFPRELAGARTTYGREVLRLGQAGALRINQLTTEYLKALGVAEARARTSNNQVVLNAIADEKQKIVERSAATTSGDTKPKGKNVLTNPDFQNKLEGWTTSSKLISVENEKGEVFVRFHGDGLDQSVTVPPGAKRYVASAKMRAASKLPTRHFGVFSIGQVGPGVPGQQLYNGGIPGPTWRTFEVEGKIDPKAEQLKLSFWGFKEGAIEVKDCVLEVR